MLVIGFSNARAGVESVIANYARAVADRINFDFLVHEELTNYSDLVEGASANNRVFIIPKKTRDPLRYERGLRALFADHAHEYDAIWDNVCHLANLDALALAKKHKIPQRILHAHMDTIAGKPWHKLFSRFNRPQVHTLPTQLWACSAQSGNGFFNGLDTTVLNNAIAYRDYAYDEEARLAQRAAWGIEEDEILLGAVGRLDVQKNHQWLLETFTELAAADERYRLVIVGAGELHDHLQRMITRLGCQDSALLVGRSTDMPACYSAFDLFVMPSLFEGLPVSIIEAQSAGLRCLLSSRISTDSDISGNCEFFDLEDRGAWLDAITHAQTHDRRHPHLSKDYDLDVQAQRFIDLIAARSQGVTP
ncbi:glycosyltransferase [Actinomyces mediterranea]|uniref:glycosyltransferase n=1 Tax=Actinomyces mediterranea TaxID=1871028 RepID=UPI000970DE88|nr:glycosyltransferase [Actinomyces mediterranea]